ncbi:uncharacterized protein [Equus caballus]|uniref:uncharacterized protein isoform X2 n=1 Tax=Equus caballus TaxID=9796 RepID=UPI0038B37E79
MLPFKYGRPMQGGVEIRSPPRFLERSAPGVPRGSPAPLPASPSPVNPESEGSSLRLRESPTWCFLGLSGRGAPEAWRASETGLEEARTPRRGRAGFPSAQRAGVTTLCLSRTSEVQEVPQGRSSPEREIMRSNLRLKSWF